MNVQQKKKNHYWIYSNFYSDTKLIIMSHPDNVNHLSQAPSLMTKKKKAG